MDFAGKPSTSTPQQAVNFLSEVDDNNIFHTLLSEIIPLSRHDLNELAGSKLFIVEDELLERRPNDGGPVRVTRYG